MPMIIAGLVSAGIGGFSGFMGNKAANKKASSMNRRLWRAIKRTQSTQGFSYAQQEAAQKKANAERLAGYDTARKEASRLGRGAKREALDREQRGYGSISQGLASRGLGSTTMGANLSRGLASDTMRSLSDIDEGLAGMFGNLALGRGETAAGGTEALSNINANRMNMETQLQQMGPLGGATLGNFQVQPRGASPWMGALSGAAPGLGTAMGGFDPQMLNWLFGMSNGGPAYGSSGYKGGSLSMQNTSPMALGYGGQ